MHRIRLAGMRFGWRLSPSCEEVAVGAGDAPARAGAAPVLSWSGGFAFSSEQAGEFIERHEADAVGRRQPRTILIIEY